MCKTEAFCTFFVFSKGMKHFILILAALAMLTACCSTRLVSAADGTQRWSGRTTEDILGTMGDPDRIDPDGEGGSILVYESAPDYDSPDYDILAPESSARTRRYAHFYLDDEGVCYRVDTNRNLPAPSNLGHTLMLGPILVDILVYLPLLSLIALL